MRYHGISLDDSFIDMIQQTSYQNALVFMNAYSYDAEVGTLIPLWNRVLSSMPEIYPNILKAVEADNA